MKVSFIGYLLEERGRFPRDAIRGRIEPGEQF